MLCEICSDANANYGYKGGIKQFCSICAKTLPNTCNLTRKLCKEETCLKEPSFNYEGISGKLYCTTHKLPGMIRNDTNKCIYTNNDIKCTIIPTYGIQGEKAKYCFEHSKLFENMIRVSYNNCKWKNGTEVCITRACYNTEGKKALYCSVHKEPGMINVVNRDKCIEDGCITRPSYNFLNEKKGIYCEIHKKPNMHNIKDKRCVHEGCVKIASYNIIGIKKPLYCDEHKLENMTNIKTKKCEFEGCNSLPTFNTIGETIKRFCAKHKEKDMIDVKHNKCIEEGCNKVAYCNIIGEKKRLYCCHHKKEDMVDLSKTICRYNDISNCMSSVGKIYDGYCVRCYVGLFPNEKKTRNYKTKELKVCEFIKENFKDYTIQFDKIVTDGCSKKRPDIYIDMGNYTIIIEVDENQHDTYGNICENKRFMEIFNDLGNRPMHLIRFNPDKYYNNKNELVKSCWSFSKEGLSIINRTMKDNWKSRLNTLGKTIKEAIENEPEKEIDIKYLYYDEI